MADLRPEIMNAVLAADRLHEQFDTKARADQGMGRIDVLDMLVKQDIPVMFRPLTGLLGAYLNKDAPGVLVTTKRQLPVQRFTAAHELGHAMLGHQPSLDSEDIIARSPFVTNVQGRYNVQEIQANAFASELLIPRWLLVKHMQRQAWSRDDMGDTDIVYQLSLRLGVSFSATCHALAHHKVITTAACDQLLSVKPKTIKQRLAAPYEPPNWYGDVWVITERDDGILMEGSRSDLVVAKLTEHSGSGYLWRLDDLASTGLAVVEDRRDADPDEERIGGVVFRTVIAAPQTGAAGHVSLRETRPWQADEPLQSLNLDVDFSGPIHAGLHDAQRKALLGAA